MNNIRSVKENVLIHLAHAGYSASLGMGRSSPDFESVRNIWDLQPGDIVLGASSRRPSDWSVSVVVKPLGTGMNDVLVHELGNPDNTCRYGNEHFIRLNNIPKSLLQTEEQQWFDLRVRKALRRTGSYWHRIRGVDFPTPRTCVVTIGAHIWCTEPVDYVDRPNRRGAILFPYEIDLGEWNKRTTLRSVIEKLEAHGVVDEYPKAFNWHGEVSLGCGIPYQKEYWTFWTRDLVVARGGS